MTRHDDPAQMSRTEASGASWETILVAYWPFNTPMRRCQHKPKIPAHVIL